MKKMFWILLVVISLLAGCAGKGGDDNSSSKTTNGGGGNGGDGNTPPSVTITAPANGAIFNTPANIMISANASDDGQVVSVEFFWGSNSLGIATQTPYSVLWSDVTQGQYTLTAVATDNLGAKTTSAAVTITVNQPQPNNQPPTVSITAPTNGATFTAPANITVNANATDLDGNVTQVEFYRDGVLIGIDLVASSGSYSVVWNNVPAGTYVLTAIAYDDDGASTTSNSVTITVTQPNQAPTVTLTAPANGATFTAPANITPTATASDPDGNITEVDINGNGILIGTDLVAPYSIVWSNVPAGTYVLTAIAYDNSGASTTSNSVTITVNTGDTDGDGVPDDVDCDPLDPDTWTKMPFRPDNDQDYLPDSSTPNNYCVGDPDTYPQRTTTWTSPLDPCLDDKYNACVTGHFGVEWAYGDTAGTWESTVYWDCGFPDTFAQQWQAAGTVTGNAPPQNRVMDSPNPAVLRYGTCIANIHVPDSGLNQCNGWNDDWFPAGTPTYGFCSSLPSGYPHFVYSKTGDSDIWGSSDQLTLDWEIDVNTSGNGANYLVYLDQGTNSSGATVAIDLTDADNDGYPNVCAVGATGCHRDNCRLFYNPGEGGYPAIQPDTDGDGVGDICEGVDDDNDGWPNADDLFPNDPTRHE